MRAHCGFFKQHWCNVGNIVLSLTLKGLAQAFVNDVMGIHIRWVYLEVLQLPWHEKWRSGKVLQDHDLRDTEIFSQNSLTRTAPCIDNCYPKARSGKSKGKWLDAGRRGDQGGSWGCEHMIQCPWDDAPISHFLNLLRRTFQPILQLKS